jgi:hypothetical protein
VQSYLAGKSAKGQILLIGAEVQRSNAMKREPYGFVIIQRNGKRFEMCAESEEEQLSWMQAITSADTTRGSSTEVGALKDLIKQQEELLKKLQKGMQTLLEQKEQKALKRPNERFYKEYVTV